MGEVNNNKVIQLSPLLPKKYIDINPNLFEERISEWEYQGKPKLTFAQAISDKTRITGKSTSLEYISLKNFKIKNEIPKNKEQYNINK